MRRLAVLMACVLLSTPSWGDEKARYTAAADYSARNKGLAVLVMRAGKIVFERYDNGHAADKPVHLHSGTKGFWSAGTAAMVEDGLLTVDDLACDTLTEWKADPRKRRITVRHLLTLTSGLEMALDQIQGLDGKAKDKYAYAVGLRANMPPGWRFVYGPSHYYALGALMKRKLPKNEDPLQYLQRRVLDPIGVKVTKWIHDYSGNPHIPNGAYLTARDWGKFGQLLLQGGRWNGKQVVKKSLIAACIEPSKTNPGHGLALWLNKPGGKAPARNPLKSSKTGGFIYPDGLPGMFAALGAGKCRMYMVPSLEMVIVRQCDVKWDRFSDPTFLRLIFGKKAE